MEEESREYTEREVQDMLLEQIDTDISYWCTVNQPNTTLRERLQGLAFSILCILDGVTNLPGFIVVPCPHPDDKQYHIDEGENWFPENHESDVKCDIAGNLHERFYNRD